MSVVILLLSFIRAEKQYDRSIPDVDRIYRIIHTQNGTFVPEQARQKLESDFPQVLAATNVNIGMDPVIWNEENHQVNIIHTDSSFFKVFSTVFVKGILEDIFKDPYQAVLTESCARRIFGDKDPLGEILNVSHKEDVRVAATKRETCQMKYPRPLIPLTWNGWKANINSSHSEMSISM
ncbi:MAG: hypothetical protein AMS26_09500 [Bacteroides sp. SM23_62]|nr:MAG: hypothetical protein AMS26_09500 [Bacteroides sp. SM23_62]